MPFFVTGNLICWQKPLSASTQYRALSLFQGEFHRWKLILSRAPLPLLLYCSNRADELNNIFLFPHECHHQGAICFLFPTVFKRTPLSSSLSHTSSMNVFKWLWIDPHWGLFLALAQSESDVERSTFTVRIVEAYVRATQKMCWQPLSETHGKCISHLMVWATWRRPLKARDAL